MGKLLIFDVDGVLEDEDKAKMYWDKAIYAAIAGKHNITYDEAIKLKSDAKKRMDPAKSKTTRYIMRELGFEDKDFFDIINSVDRTGIISRNPNCEEMLAEVSRGNVIITYSNGPTKSTNQALEILGIAKYIKQRFTAEDFDESKPSTRNLEIMMGKMGFGIENTVMIGNSFEKDCLPAVQLGMKAILYDKHGEYKVQNGVVVVRDLVEIVGLV